MPGIPQGAVVEELEVPDEVDAVELALAMCPPGMAIEVHSRDCPLSPCACLPRVIERPAAS